VLAEESLRLHAWPELIRQREGVHKERMTTLLTRTEILLIFSSFPPSPFRYRSTSSLAKGRTRQPFFTRCSSERVVVFSLQDAINAGWYLKFMCDP